MSERLQKIINVPTKIFSNARKKLKESKPGTIFGKIAKETGLTISTISQLAMWSATRVIADNTITRKMESVFASMDINKKGEKFLSFLKKYPEFPSLFIWWIVAGGLIAGTTAGTGISANKSDEKIQEKNKIEKDIKQTIYNMQMDPKATDSVWQKQIDMITPYVLSHIISSEGFIKRAYLDNGTSGTLTLGSGFTINDDVHRDFAKQVLDRQHVGNGSGINPLENRVLVESWLREKVFPKIRKNFDVKLDVKLFVILSVAAYNVGESTFDLATNSGYPLRQVINSRKSKQEIANTFVRCFGKTKGTKWGGMANKYAVCAMYYMGYIDDVTFLNSIAEAPYTLETLLKNNGNNGRLLIYDGNETTARPVGFKVPKNINQLMTKTKYRITKGTLQKPVKKYLTEQQQETIEIGIAYSGAREIIFGSSEKQLNKNSNEYKAMVLNEEGEDLYHSGQYDLAIEKFEKALHIDGKNFIAYSNLSLAYYRLGKYENGAQVVIDFINSSAFLSAPNYVKSYSYFNAAMCRIAIGDNYLQSKKYDLAIENYKKAQINIEQSEKLSEEGAIHDDMRVNIINGIDSAKKGIEKQSLMKKGSAKIQSKKKSAFNYKGNNKKERL